MSDTSLKAVINHLKEALLNAGIDHPAFEARLIVSEVAGISSADFITKPDLAMNDEHIQGIYSILDRRITGEPLHRILGHREFYGLDFLLSESTLIPRPDTEILVDRTLPYLARIIEEKGNATLLDMGTGTGAICLSLLNAEARAIGFASDIAEGALKTAKENAKRLAVEDRFTPILSNWFECVNGRFDIIISNPPYIRSDVIPTLEREVKDFDPMAALDGGIDGLDPYRIIADGAASHLHDKGIVCLEIGFDQKDTVTAIFQLQGFHLLEAAQDYGGNDRVLIFSH